MLIYLAEELGAQFAQLSQSVKFGNAMRNLALCEREGKHVLAGSYAVLTQLKRWHELSQRERAVFERCHMEIQTRLQLWKNASALIEVSNVEAGEIRRLDEEQQLRFVVPYGYFADSARVQKVQLIGEDIKDAKLYELAAKAYQQRFGFGRDRSEVSEHKKLFHLCINPRGGSGSGIPLEVEQEAKTHMVLAVTDGDVGFPGATPATNSNQVRTQQTVAGLANHAIVDHVVTDGRSIENLLPEDVILAAHFLDPSSSSTTEQHLPPEQVTRPHRTLLADKEARRYLDLKAGLRLRQTQPGSTDCEDERRFLEAVAKRLKPEANTDTCPSNGNKKSCDKRDCDCVVVAGYGNKLLEKVLAHLTHSPEKTLTLTPELERIARHVAAFGCAAKPGNANTSILAPRSFAGADPEASH